MQISIVVITARQEPGFVELVKSLQPFASEIELVYVDKLKSSRNGHWEEAMARLGIDFIHAEDPPSGGPAPSTARNFGISQASGDWIVCIDDLTTFNDDVLRIHKVAYSLGFDAVAGSYTLNGKLAANSDSRYGDPLASNGDWISHRFYGMHMGFTKKSWEQVGGFDESFDGVYGQEDCDFGRRLFLNGAAMAWLPTAQVNCQKDDRHGSIQAKADFTHTAFVYGELKWRNDCLILWNKMLGKIDTRN
mgnify:CR=1 FL=1